MDFTDELYGSYKFLWIVKRVHVLKFRNSKNLGTLYEWTIWSVEECKFRRWSRKSCLEVISQDISVFDDPFNSCIMSFWAYLKSMTEF